VHPSTPRPGRDVRATREETNRCGGGGGGGGSVPSASEVLATYLLSLAAAVRRANTVARIVSGRPVSSEKRVDYIVIVIRLAPPFEQLLSKTRPNTTALARVNEINRHRKSAPRL